MQDNDLPQIGTPMQTDETRVEVTQADREMAAEVIQTIGRAGWLDSRAAMLAGDMDMHPYPIAFARHRQQFAAPPAVEREGQSKPKRPLIRQKHNTVFD